MQRGTMSNVEILPSPSSPPSLSQPSLPEVVALAPAPAATAFGSTPPRVIDFAAITSDAYDARVAYLLAVASGWAYADEETLAKKLRYYGLPRATVDRMQVINPAMLVVATAFLVRSQDRKTGVLVFRGTEPTNLINWLTDADTCLRPFHGGSIHAGFHANVEAIWTDVEQQLRAAIADGMTTLYITGHSLGGAMAVVAAARIFFAAEYRDWHGLVRGIYTFGQPMVGDAAFGAQCERGFGAKLHRHVYRSDVVPALPPWSVGDYTHVGSERLAVRAHEQWVASPRPRMRRAVSIAATVLLIAGGFFTRRLRFLERFALAYSLDDHVPERYIETCKASL